MAPPELLGASVDLKQAANTLMVQYEYLGNLVYQRIVPIQTLDLLVGGSYGLPGAGWSHKSSSRGGSVAWKILPSGFNGWRKDWKYMVEMKKPGHPHRLQLVAALKLTTYALTKPETHRAGSGKAIGFGLRSAGILHIKLEQIRGG
jgi:hypothetical protein